MKNMAKRYDDFKVDYRTAKLNIAKGVISREEYEEFIKNLPDLNGQFDEIPAYIEPEPEQAHDDSSGGLTFIVE